MNEIRSTLLDTSDNGAQDRKKIAGFGQILRTGAKIGEIPSGYWLLWEL